MIISGDYTSEHYYFCVLWYKIAMRYCLYIALYTSYLLCCSCSIFQESKTEQHIVAPPSSPMSCKIKGQIIRILKPGDKDTGSVCFRYPCRAMVRIAEIMGCGSSIPFPSNQGDTIEIKFPFTLVNTARVFPRMKVQYPGLNNGDFFIADIEQHLKVGSGVEFTINGYELAAKPK